MTYSYKCKCGHEFDWYNVPMENRDSFKPNCPECGETKAKRVIKNSMLFIIPENDDTISPKQDSYWANAEENRIKNSTKRFKDEQEKLQYDSKYRSNKIAGAARAKTFNDEDD